LARNRTFVLLVAALAAALAASSFATASSARGGKLKGAVHADVNVIARDGTATSFALDHGKVTALSSTSLTIERADKQSLTFALGSTTTSRGNLRVGSRVLVTSQGGSAVQVTTGRRLKANGNTLSLNGLFRLMPGSQSANRRGKARKLAQAVHVDYRLLLANGTTQTLAVDKGTIASASTSSLALKRADGPTVSFVLNASTKVRGTLAPNAKAVVTSRDGTALRVRAGAKQNNRR
jgi:hypothetical protein